MRAYTYRLYPTRAQERELRRWLQLSKYIYNAALEQRIDWWRRGKLIIDSRSAWHPERGRDLMLSQTRQLQDARREFEWAQMPANVQNHILVVLDRAYRGFRRRNKANLRGGYPRFCRRWRTVTFPSYGKTHKWEGDDGRWGYLRLVGIGRVRVRLGRRHRLTEDADLGECTITLHETGRWELAILDRRPSLEPWPRTGRVVGLNRGVRHLIATSEGEVVDGLRPHPDAERNLLRAQRALARAQRGSKGREKVRMRIARAHHRIAAERERRLGEIARDLVEHYDIIAIEDYDIERMVRRADEVAPDLARRIIEQGWSILEKRLRDRCERHGKVLVVVGSDGISQSCPRCGSETAHPVGQRVYQCSRCSYRADRDVAAAKVVLQRAFDPGSVRSCHGSVALIENHQQNAKAL